MKGVAAVSVWRRSLLILIALLPAGCSSSQSAPQYDSKNAEETLVQALDAWKNGQIGSLAKGNPPLRFEDEDYRDGCRLTGYRVEDGQSPLRPFADVRVSLSLVDRRGKAVEKTAVYQVSLEPGRAVLRND
jgi:hypothetical protein